MRLLGAVIGDISGSWYEFRGFKQRPAALVTQRDFFTDDSVLTLAVAEGMMNGFEQVDRTKLMQDESAQNAFRLEIVKDVLEAYVEGKTERIAELEEERLPLVKSKDGEIISWRDWNGAASSL